MGRRLAEPRGRQISAQFRLAGARGPVESPFQDASFVQAERRVDAVPARWLPVAAVVAEDQAPPVIFTRGVVLVDDPAVSVVGSREASEQGLRFAAGVVVSGRE